MNIQHTVNGRTFVIDAQMLDYLVIAAEALAAIVQAQPTTAPAPTPLAPASKPRSPRSPRSPRTVPPGFLNTADLLLLVPFGSAEMYRRMKVGKFPRPIRRGVWSRADVEAWTAGTWKPTP
ncbi:DNA-binding transcriptional activator AlpA [uncultured Caudovirales phage]|uniref:DNA-binding transcriptional activator AlpA n=1 Tax=uncultured Caudovirales phage TaxID=2100421 RepID=A0A6J5NZY9_9CAUD|nr:DNA-binding transcriptional activator AlpA [uncultured Caudovirales phage]